MMQHIDAECWCDPVYLIVCPECDGRDETCWRCGQYPVRMVRADSSDEADVAVHEPEPEIRAIR